MFHQEQRGRKKTPSVAPCSVIQLRRDSPKHISYVELEGNPTDNLDALHTLVNQMHDAGVGYFSFNAKMDCCTNCGFVGIIGDTCPSCGHKDTPSTPIIRPRRVTGL